MLRKVCAIVLISFLPSLVFAVTISELLKGPIQPQENIQPLQKKLNPAHKPLTIIGNGSVKAVFSGVMSILLKEDQENSLWYAEVQNVGNGQLKFSDYDFHISPAIRARQYSREPWTDVSTFYDQVLAPPFVSQVFAKGRLEITRGSKTYDVSFHDRPTGAQAVWLPDNLTGSNSLSEVTIKDLEIYTYFCGRPVVLQRLQRVEGLGITRPLHDREKAVTIEVD